MHPSKILELVEFRQFKFIESILIANIFYGILMFGSAKLFV